MSKLEPTVGNIVERAEIRGRTSLLKELRTEIEERVHYDIHKSDNWGMETKVRVVHWDSVLQILDNHLNGGKK